jgi:hypothetical protein
MGNFITRFGCALKSEGFADSIEKKIKKMRQRATSGRLKNPAFQAVLSILARRRSMTTSVRNLAKRLKVPLID